MTLTDFLLARIAEEERDARPFVNELGHSRPWVAAEVGGRVNSGPNPLGGDGEVATATTHVAAVHIARHDPTRVLAECEAKRRTLEVAQLFGCANAVGRCLALPYADHPDYDESWRP